MSLRKADSSDSWDRICANLRSRREALKQPSRGTKTTVGQNLLDGSFFRDASCLDPSMATVSAVTTKDVSSQQNALGRVGHGKTVKQASVPTGTVGKKKQGVKGKRKLSKSRWNFLPGPKHGGENVEETEKNISEETKISKGATVHTKASLKKKLRSKLMKLVKDETRIQSREEIFDFPKIGEERNTLNGNIRSGGRTESRGDDGEQRSLSVSERRDIIDRIKRGGFDAISHDHTQLPSQSRNYDDSQVFERESILSILKKDVPMTSSASSVSDDALTHGVSNTHTRKSEALKPSEQGTSAKTDKPPASLSSKKSKEDTRAEHIDNESISDYSSDSMNSIVAADSSTVMAAIDSKLSTESSVSSRPRLLVGSVHSGTATSATTGIQPTKQSLVKKMRGVFGKKDVTVEDKNPINVAPTRQPNNTGMTPQILNTPYASPLLSFRDRKLVQKARKYSVEAKALLKDALSQIGQNSVEVHMLTMKAFAFASEAEKTLANVKPPSLQYAQNLQIARVGSTSSEDSSTDRFFQKVERDQEVRRQQAMSMFRFRDYCWQRLCCTDGSLEQTRILKDETAQILQTLDKHIGPPQSVDTGARTKSSNQRRVTWAKTTETKLIEKTSSDGLGSYSWTLSGESDSLSEAVSKIPVVPEDRPPESVSVTKEEDGMSLVPTPSFLSLLGGLSGFSMSELDDAATTDSTAASYSNPLADDDAFTKVTSLSSKQSSVSKLESTVAETTGSTKDERALVSFGDTESAHTRNGPKSLPGESVAELSIVDSFVDGNWYCCYLDSNFDDFKFDDDTLTRYTIDTRSTWFHEQSQGWFW